MLNSLAFNPVQPYPNTLDQLYGLTVITPATAEPVSYAEILSHLYLMGADADETYLRMLGIAGRQYVETATKLTLINTTFEATFDIADNNGIRLPRRPVQSVTSVTYKDQAGTSQTLASNQYDLDTKAIWTLVRPKPNIPFPVTSFSPNAVTVRFVAGTSPDAAGVSAYAKIAILTWVAHMYENREAIGKPQSALPHSFESLLWMLSAPGV